MTNNPLPIKIICGKCQKEIKGARYFIKKLKAWVCMHCYLEMKDEDFI